MTNLEVLTVGDCTVDNVFEVDQDEASILCNHRSQEKELCFNYGEKIPINSITRGFGGSALNAVIGFSKLGLTSAISTIIGDDENGKEIVEFLNNKKVNTSYIKTDQQTNMSVILIYGKERTVLSYHKPRDYSILELPPCKNIYFASAGKGAEKIYPMLIARVTAGSKLFFNPGSWELANFDTFAPLVQHCEALIINKDEADLIIGEGSTQDQLKKMIRLGTNTAVITDGPRGAYLQNGSDQYHMEIYSGQVVDPTGAGDSFSVGFVSGLIYGKSLEECCRWGMVNSASVIENIGANEGLLVLDKLERVSQESKNLTLKALKENNG